MTWGGGGGGGAAVPPALYQEGQGRGGEGGLLDKGKYLLLIERIRSCYYRTNFIELHKLYDITNFCWKTVRNVSLCKTSLFLYKSET